MFHQIIFILNMPHVILLLLLLDVLGQNCVTSWNCPEALNQCRFQVANIRKETVYTRDSVRQIILMIAFTRSYSLHGEIIASYLAENNN